MKPRSARRVEATASRQVARPPLLLAAFGLVVIGLLVMPLLGLVLRAPWSELASRLAETQVRDALRLSLLCSGVATVLAMLLGVPVAWLLARTNLPGRDLVRALVLLPLLLPPLVTGVGLLTAFGRSGLVGRWLDSLFGLTLPFTTVGVILAVTFVGLPFVVIMVEAALRSADTRFEEAAATLGASRFIAFRTITLPAIAPSLLGGAALAWARTLGEFGATVTFAGNLPGVTQTMPLAVYLSLEVDLGRAILLSLMLMIPTLAVLIILKGRTFRGMTT